MKSLVLALTLAIASPALAGSDVSRAFVEHEAERQGCKNGRLPIRTIRGRGFVVVWGQAATANWFDWGWMW